MGFQGNTSSFTVSDIPKDDGKGFLLGVRRTGTMDPSHKTLEVVTFSMPL